MKKQFKDETGSALVWVLVLAVIFGILGMAIGWVALSMNKRSIDDYVLTQGYFTSRSAVDTVYENLNGYSSGNYSDSLCSYLNANLINGEKKVTFTDFFATNNNENADIANMGNCTVTGTLEKGKVKIEGITGEADSNDVTLWAYRDPNSYTNPITKENVNTTLWPSKYWASTLPSGSGSREMNTIYIGASEGSENGTITNEAALKNNIDVAVYTVPENEKRAGKLCITKDQMSEKKAIFIYIEKGAELSLYGVDVSNTYLGTLYSEGKWFSGYDKDADTSISEDWNAYYGPDIFIYVEAGGTLDFERKNEVNGTTYPYPFYICGKTESEKQAVVKMNSSGQSGAYLPPGTTIATYFQQDVTVAKHGTDENWLSFDKNKDGLTPKRNTISGYKQAGSIADQSKSESGLIPDYWTKYKYEKGTSD